MENREKILIRTSWTGVVGNAVLSSLKIVTGIFAGSMAVLSDGIDSATDVASCLVTLFTAKIVSRPPNSRYVYGYEKADDVATKILSFIIFFAGLQMLISTGKSLFRPEMKALPSTIAIYVTGISIVGKLLLAYYQTKQGKKVNSSMLIANGKNMRNDVLISTGVVVGLFFTFVLNLPILDTVTGLLISIYIIKSSVDIFLDANLVLMDGVKDPSVYKKIFDAVDAVPGASNPHRVRLRQIGHLYMVELDVEVDGRLSLSKAHQIAQAVEQSIKGALENVYDIFLHVEPEGEVHSKEEFGLDRDSFDGAKEPSGGFIEKKNVSLTPGIFKKHRK
ncbi:MAG: cation diffusion facilitator family transporter [Dysgonamonadaceae bacterium]|jgi:cation diffusion facilitator family transporter|nr:cation diffusion facilitator family transporter [Dysgonamonadaceae bacterium]